MTLKTHMWVSLWFVLTTPIILLDVSYCFLRQGRTEGGDLAWFFLPYQSYQHIDRLYGKPWFDRGDGFPNAQSLLNIFETTLNLLYVYAAHIAAWPPAPLLGVASATMTLSKTLLYWAQEYFCDWCAVGHNSVSDIIMYWVSTNVWWVIVPALIIWNLGKDIAADLHFAAKLVANQAKMK
ncbi:hypothetical protein MIND_00614500 [Mycena indigotica]|uniref:EXPERA domain-containing protein n=1 Tax=Mycena indigotica TaxID=2126181 RepID=A0A8H6SQX8_9AGAR|nr:uncharacterized protein MIND_00614500 [Mycena indigotica]KAF7303846.1 hypothetical protein MIND_00614500 [Mycena indigotica]